MPLDGSVLLGPGVALISTHGHATGNQSLVLNSDTGIWAVSENAIATECLTPARIPSLAHAARNWGYEVILNTNTLETTYEQYNSFLIEKTIIDVSQQDSQFVQFFPSSELTGARLNPGTSPTYTHGAIEHG